MRIRNSRINKQVIKAHKKKNVSLLVELYAKASKSTSNSDAACFLATQAYALALEVNHPLSKELFEFLLVNNRENKLL